MLRRGRSTGKAHASVCEEDGAAGGVYGERIGVCCGAVDRVERKSCARR
jgi:hypothetical protein